MIRLLRLRGVIRFRPVIRLLRRVIGRLRRVPSLMMGTRDVSVSSFADNITLVITGTNIFIEKCSVATLECVLLSVVMAVVINLIIPRTLLDTNNIKQSLCDLTLSLRVCVVSARVFVAAVKAGVGLSHGDW